MASRRKRLRRPVGSMTAERQMGVPENTLGESPKLRLPDKSPYLCQTFAPTRMLRLGIKLTRGFHCRPDTIIAPNFGVWAGLADSHCGLHGQPHGHEVVLEGSGATRPGQVFSRGHRHGRAIGHPD